MENKQIVLTSSYKKDLKKFQNDKTVQSELNKVIKFLQRGEELPSKYKNHSLKQDWKGFYDCHIRPNVVLIYDVNETQICLVRIGNHSNLGLTEGYISEDTCSVPSKTSYVEDGFDDNGIYYFGKKPKLPVNWKEYKRNDNKKVTLESYSKPDDASCTYIEFDSKRVFDEEGYETDYTMYAVIELPDSSEWSDYVKHNANKGRGIPNSIISSYVFILGDKEIYNPNDDEIEFDHECSTKGEALDWFDSYTGFDEEF